MPNSATLIVFVFNLSLTIAVSFFWMRYLKNEHFHAAQLNAESLPDQTATYIGTILRDHLPFSAVELWIAILGAALWIQFAFKSVLQFLNENTNVATPKLAKCLSNIVSSFLLYSFILGSLIAYMWLSNYQISSSESQSAAQLKEAEAFKTEFILDLLKMYFVSRVVFFVGYLFGIMTGFQSFRAIGVGLTFGAIAAAISEIVGLNVWAYF